MRDSFATKSVKGEILYITKGLGLAVTVKMESNDILNVGEDMLSFSGADVDVPNVFDFLPFSRYYGWQLTPLHLVKISMKKNRLEAQSLLSSCRKSISSASKL